MARPLGGKIKVYEKIMAHEPGCNGSRKNNCNGSRAGYKGAASRGPSGKKSVMAHEPGVMAHEKKSVMAHEPGVMAHEKKNVMAHEPGIKARLRGAPREKKV